MQDRPLDLALDHEVFVSDQLAFEANRRAEHGNLAVRRLHGRRRRRYAYSRALNGRCLDSLGRHRGGWRDGRGGRRRRLSTVVDDRSLRFSHRLLERNAVGSFALPHSGLPPSGQSAVPVRLAPGERAMCSTLALPLSILMLPLKLAPSTMLITGASILPRTTAFCRTVIEFWALRSP